MAEKYFPFESVSDDREYYASDFAAFYADIISNGISKRSPGGLKVSAGSGMNVTISTGVAWIEGHIYHNTTSKTLALNIGGSKPRIDRIVVRLDNVARTITAMVVNGTEANVPTAPALRRDGDVYDIGLATVRVPASAISVSASNITDTTGDPNICGAVAIMGAEDVINKVLTISESSNDTQYPTAKAVYTLFAQLINNGVGNDGKVIADIDVTWTASDGRYLGDVNGDGTINNSDVVQFLRYLGNESTNNFSVAAADINGDGEANNDDRLILEKLVTAKKPEQIICRITVKYTDKTSGVIYGTIDKPGTATDSGGGGNATDGVGILSLTFKETNANGDNVYSINLTDGRSYDVIMPHGPAGGTPQRGVDYWTQADINTIKGYVDTAILGGAW